MTDEEYLAFRDHCIGFVANYAWPPDRLHVITLQEKTLLDLLEYISHLHANLHNCEKGWWDTFPNDDDRDG